MKKITKFLKTAFVSICLMLVATSCSNNFSEVKTHYTGTADKLSATAKKLDGTEVAVEYEIKNLELSYVESSAGDSLVLTYDWYDTYIEDGNENGCKEPLMEVFNLYKDSKGLFFLAEIAMESKSIETQEGKEPVVTKGYTTLDYGGKVYVTIDGDKLSYTLPTTLDLDWDENEENFYAKVIERKFEFTKAN